MFCHSSLDEHVSTTTAGRLRAVIGTPCFPFSVSQQQGSSTFTALQLASDLLIAEPEIHTILIVAAEKWCPPFSRWTEQGIVQGDAAGAILVERSGPTSYGLLVIDARASRLHRFATPAPLSSLDIRRDWLLALRSTSLVPSLMPSHDCIAALAWICNLLDRIRRPLRLRSWSARLT
ncbi:hypothetical protein WT38_22775 [Burkholderia territorii]|nr:hypothetical protein WT38_22775 [Burkholderia territorii]